MESLQLIPKYHAPSSWWEHVPIAHWLVESLKPRIIVELGSHYGVSLFSFCEAAEKYSPRTFIYAIDSWEGDEQAGYYDNKVYKQVNSYREKNHKQRCSLIRDTFERASVYFEDSTVDLIHIDGLHTYEAVKEDYETWEPKLKDGGTLLFHDCSVREGGFGVWKLWEEIKNKPEFYCLELSNGYGLGIATKTTNLPTWHEQFKNAQDLLITKGRLLSQIQDMREEIEEIGRKEITLEKHSQNLMSIIEENEKHIASLVEWKEINEKHVASLVEWKEENKRYIANLEAWKSNKESEERKKLRYLIKRIGSRIKKYLGISL